jgi:hypothetical protein
MHDISPDAAALMHALSPSSSPGIARLFGFDSLLHATCNVCCRCQRPPPTTSKTKGSAAVPVANASSPSSTTSLALQHPFTNAATPPLNPIRLPPDFPLAPASSSSSSSSSSSYISAASVLPPLPSTIASAACSCSLPPPQPVVQDYVFAPCGWSMNGMWGDVYWTMHVTPESQCSYASLETNVPVSSYSAIVARVVEAFKPKRFQTIQFIDDDSHLGLAMAADASLLAPAVMFGYTITNVSVNQYGPGYVIQMVHYVGDG